MAEKLLHIQIYQHSVHLIYNPECLISQMKWKREKMHLIYPTFEFEFTNVIMTDHDLSLLSMIKTIKWCHAFKCQGELCILVLEILAMKYKALALSSLQFLQGEGRMRLNKATSNLGYSVHKRPHEKHFCGKHFCGKHQ